jgi:hypothetical protein
MPCRVARSQDNGQHHPPQRLHEAFGGGPSGRWLQTACNQAPQGLADMPVVTPSFPRYLRLTAEFSPLICSEPLPPPWLPAGWQHLCRTGCWKRQSRTHRTSTSSLDWCTRRSVPHGPRTIVCQQPARPSRCPAPMVGQEPARHISDPLVCKDVQDQTSSTQSHPGQRQVCVRPLQPALFWRCQTCFIPLEQNAGYGLGFPPGDVAVVSQMFLCNGARAAIRAKQVPYRYRAGSANISGRQDHRLVRAPGCPSPTEPMSAMTRWPQQLKQPVPDSRAHALSCAQARGQNVLIHTCYQQLSLHRCQPQRYFVYVFCLLIPDTVPLFFSSMFPCCLQISANGM